MEPEEVQNSPKLSIAEQEKTGVTEISPQKGIAATMCILTPKKRGNLGKELPGHHHVEEYPTG